MIPESLVRVIRAPLDAIGGLLGNLEARSRMYNELAWGRSVELVPPWDENQIRPVFSRDATSLKQRIPFTQGMILSVDAPLPADASDAYALRWVLTVGTGGGVAEYTIDAGGAIRLTAPAEQFRLALRAEAIAGVAFGSPTGNIQASAFIADGAAEGNGPTYTQAFDVAAGQVSNIVPPRGAVTFRVLGDPAEPDSPYSADVEYNSIQVDGTTMESYEGDMLEPIRYTPMPFTPQAMRLRVNNTANAAAAAGWIEWGIDL
jgi:hypothetical protein